MIELMTESRGTALAIRASGTLTEEDYEKVLIPKVEALLAEHGRLNVLFVMDEDFKGWQAGAAWDDARFGLRHRNDFARMAVVGGPRWVEWCTRLGALLMGGEVRTFAESELQAAKDWIGL